MIQIFIIIDQYYLLFPILIMDAQKYLEITPNFKIPISLVDEYIVSIDLCLYDSGNCESLATQAAKNRQLKIVKPFNISQQAIEVKLCEDHYLAWLPLENLEFLKPAMIPYQNRYVDRTEIEAKIHDIIDFTLSAMKVPNFYLWGGTVPPHYDCSGLIQHSFANFGIWLPRDSYQQEEFTTKIEKAQLKKGDLIFFGKEKVNHVALYLGDNKYIHSSGKEIGNNSIGINDLDPNIDQVSANYYQILWGFGRVEKSL